jgi:hypothetical protein
LSKKAGARTEGGYEKKEQKESRWEGRRGRRVRSSREILVGD